MTKGALGRGGVPNVKQSQNRKKINQDLSFIQLYKIYQIRK